MAHIVILPNSPSIQTSSDMMLHAIVDLCKNKKKTVEEIEKEFDKVVQLS